ncbi:uncharacterized protein LOC125777773 [Bactrocera dorsalis]|uniref:Uncharacterized protein LOC125777773 n=1 Tax=Bactrocera dorsalis TaxID=27457 RepID=A0ABM3JJ70_BACDO|nr:uncharacterized protein LOC125777773 [Bactrocera dorsalis]
MFNFSLTGSERAIAKRQNHLNSINCQSLGGFDVYQLEKRDDQIKIPPIIVRMERFFIILSPFVTAISSKNTEGETARRLKDIKCRRQPAVGENALLAATREEEHLAFQTVERISNGVNVGSNV